MDDDHSKTKIFSIHTLILTLLVLHFIVSAGFVFYSFNNGQNYNLIGWGVSTVVIIVLFVLEFVKKKK